MSCLADRIVRWAAGPLPLAVGLVVGALAGSGCAESRTVGSDGGSTEAGRPDVGPSDGGRDAGPSPVCPAAPPSASDPCSPTGLVCGYGGSVDTRCRMLAECVAGGFQLSVPPSSCTEPMPASCPAAPPSPGTTCSPSALSDACSYASSSTVCECVEFLCGGACQLLDPPQWVCHGPPATPGCPSVAPNYGDACDDDGLECRYRGGGCQGGLTLRCSGGYFRGVLEICPL